MLAALRDVYGPAAGWMDLGRLLAEVRDPHADRADSARYWLNWLVASSAQWMGLEAWQACAAPREHVEPRTAVALGFDGSKFDDSTALIGCRLADGHLFVLGVWEKPDGAAGRGWEVPRSEVDAAVHDAFRDLDDPVKPNPVRYGRVWSHDWPHRWNRRAARGEWSAQ